MGRIAREGMLKYHQLFIEKYKPDFVIANVENLSGGKGISERTLKQMQAAGINFFTSGNHVFDKNSAIPIFEQDNYQIIRPANYPPTVPGSGFKIHEIGTKRIAIINLMGRAFIREHFDCPFRAVDKILNQLPKNISAIIIDLHAEATSEKQAMKFYLDGKISALLGTHTHVQTSDEQITNQKTAYITDIGMVGAKNAILGVELNAIIENFKTQMPVTQTIPDAGTCIFNGVYLEIDAETGNAQSIARIRQEYDV